MKRKTKFIIFVPLAVILIISVSAIFILNSFIGTEKFKDMLTGRIKEQLHSDVYIGEWSASIFSGIQFEELNINQPPGFGTGNLVKADYFTFKFNFWDLLKKKISITEVVISEPRINLEQNEEGKWFFQSASDSTKTDQTLPQSSDKDDDSSLSPLIPVYLLGLQVEKFKIINANFIARDYSGNVIGELKNCNINGKVDIINTDKFAAVMNIMADSIKAPAEVTGLDADLAISDLKTLIKVNNNNAEIENLSLNIFDGRIDAKVISLNYQKDSPEFDIQLNFKELSSRPILAMAGQPLDMISGPLTGSMSVKMQILSVDSLRQNLHSIMDNDVFAKMDKDMLPPLRALSNDINIESNINISKIDTINIDTPEKIRLNNLKTNIRINNNGVQVENLSLNIFGGKIDAKINSTDYLSSSPEFDIQMNFKELDPEPILTMAGQPVDMISGPLTGSMRGKTQILSVDSLMQNLDSIMNSDIFTKMDKELLPSLYTLLNDIDMESNIKISKIDANNIGTIKEIKLSNIDIPFSVAKQEISAKDIKIDLWGGTVGFSFTTHIHPDTPHVKVNIRVENLEQEPIFKILKTSNDYLQGTFNTTIEMEGSLKNPLPFIPESIKNLNLRGHVSVKDLSLKPSGKINTIEMPFDIQNNRLTVTDFFIKAFGGDMNTSLTVDKVANYDTFNSGLMPVFDIKSKISNLDARTLFDVVMQDPEMIGGELNADIAMAGTGNTLANLNATGAFALPFIDVKMVNTMVKNIKGEIKMKNENANVENFTAEIYNGSILASGGFGLSTNDFRGKMTLLDLDISKALEGPIKEIPSMKSFLNSTDVMTGTICGTSTVTGNIDHSEEMNGDYTFNIKDGVISGNPILSTLSKVLDTPEINDIRFSKINTKGSIHGMKVNVDEFYLSSTDIAVNSENGIIDLEKESLNIPVSIGLSPRIAKKLNKPVKEVQYGLTEKSDGLRYLPTFTMSGSLNSPDIKKALIEVLVKTTATGFLKKGIFKSLGLEEKQDPEASSKSETEETQGLIDDLIGVQSEKEKEEEKESHSKQDLFEDILGGLLGEEEDNEEKNGNTNTEEDDGKKLNPKELLKGIFGF